ncbi:50S ribosomal protein L18 [Candidatus Saccharibacteria bacterium]|nr:50S ribosomal protein L18 [Candidatus Saccharibacteria bacterium]MDQ5958469.1 large subunit ribosomal protein [Patescibacteria group bacterium]
MSNTVQKSKNLQLRKARVRSVVSGTSERPRLSVSISNIHVSAQIINDETGNTLASATSVGKKMTGNLTDKAVIVGTNIAKAAKKINVKKVSFDRNGKQYHGRIKALAEAARKEGLEF